MAMDAHLWQLNQTEKYKTLLSEFSDDDIRETFEIAVKSMTYLNKNGKIHIKYSVFIKLTPVIFSRTFNAQVSGALRHGYYRIWFIGSRQQSRPIPKGKRFVQN